MGISEGHTLSRPGVKTASRVKEYIYLDNQPLAVWHGSSLATTGTVIYKPAGGSHAKRDGGINIKSLRLLLRLLSRLVIFFERNQGRLVTRIPASIPGEIINPAVYTCLTFQGCGP